jgi:hypothetical protein
MTRTAFQPFQTQPLIAPNMQYNFTTYNEIEKTVQTGDNQSFLIR